MLRCVWRKHMPIPVDTFWLFEIGNLISNTVLCEGMDWFGLFLSLQDFDPSPIQKILALSLCVSRIFQLSTWHFWNVPKTQHRTKMSCSAFRFLWTWSTTTTKWIQITAIVITTHQILNFQLPSFQIHFDQFAHMYVDIQQGIPPR